MYQAIILIQTMLLIIKHEINPFSLIKNYTKRKTWLNLFKKEPSSRDQLRENETSRFEN